MRNLLKMPENPIAAFLKGAGTATLTLGGPMAVVALVEGTKADLWTRVSVPLLITFIGALLLGLAFAVWALLQRWAYRQVTTKNDPW